MHERLRYEYALLLDKSGNTAQAIRSMQKVLELNPNHPDALNYIGYYWANSNTNLDKALKYILLAVQLKPQSGYIRDSLGWIYYRLGEFDKAIIELQDALSLEPTDPYIYEHLGDCYQAKNENEKALEIYTKALELFEDTDLKKILQDKIYGLSEKQ
jgi:tetratricopeptide (TPR) repeat protein